MTLDATELARTRRITGASNTTDMPDSEMQVYHNLAITDAPDSTLILPYTYVYILRDLWGTQRPRQDRNTTHGDRQTRSQIDTSTKDKLDYWEGVAGLSGGGILSSGTIDLDIDEDEVTA
jgi:hypothetical protein